MTKEEFRDYVDTLRSQDEISYNVYSELIDGIDTLEQEPILDKIRAEIEEKYGDYDICEWFEDYDYEENNISEYRSVGNVSDILAIIDKYKEDKA